MLEADSWADAPDCVYLNTCNVNSVKEVSILASEDSGTFNYCFRDEKIDSIDSELCQNSTILDDENASVGENSCSFPLGPISQPDDLRFFHNNHEDKDTNDLSYYSWSEMGNFEDVDMMFSCDSTFGLGAGNEDDLGWFSSSDTIEASGDGLRSDFKFQNPASTALENVSGRIEVPRTKKTGSVCDSGTKNEPLSCDDNSWPSEKYELANLSPLSFVNGSSNSECKVVPLEKININKKHADHQNRLEGKRKGVFLENGDALHNTDGLVEEGEHFTEATGPKDNLISSGIQQQNKANEPESGYLCSSFSYMSDYSCSDQTVLHPTSTITESGNNGFMLPKDCHAPNHVQTMQRSPDPSNQMATITTSEKKAEKLLQHSEIPFENSSDLESITTGIPAELGSSIVSIVAGSTSISSGFNEVAEEDAGFHQLQHVTGRLDIRTKLCIRDSLYRLARSADQRHREANLGNDSGDDRDGSQPLISEKTNKRKGYMDMERETNPVDRSIAHLLFLRSSVSSVAP